jgi:hypothetical protein
MAPGRIELCPAMDGPFKAEIPDIGFCIRKTWNTSHDRKGPAACTTRETSFENLSFLFALCPEIKIALAVRTAQPV